MEEHRVFSVGIDGVSPHHSRINAEVFDLPGCACVVSEVQRLESMLPAAISEHLFWLRRHGIDAGDPGSISYEVVEIVSEVPPDIADREFCFEQDLVPVDSAEVEEAIDLINASRRDLISVISGLPQLVLDYSPPEEALDFDEWAMGPRSIKGIVAHVAGAEGYYRTNISDSGPDLPRNSRLDLSLQREKLLERLRSLSLEDLRRVFESSHPWQGSAREIWTVRKAIRRIIRHERYHTKEIEQRLAWLLIGTPVLDSNSGKRNLSGPPES